MLLQEGNRRFTKSETVPNMNGFNMNPWSEIPNNTVAACGYIIVIDSDRQVYTYHLNHDLDNNNPTPTLTGLGKIKFSGL